MWLDLITKERIDSLDIRIGYGGFNRYRKEIAKSFDEDFGKFIDISYNLLYDWCQTDEDRLNDFTKNNKGLFILMTHSDCDGLLTYKECKLVYDDISNLEIKSNDLFEFHNQFINALKHCYTKRINLYFN